jgi:antitoxin PrlF
MKTTVSEKGQVTIPKQLRERLGLRKGQVLEVRERKGTVILVKRNSRDALDELYGILKLGRRTDEIMDELRGSEKPR